MRTALAQRRSGTGLSYTQQVLARQASAHAVLMPNGGHQLVVASRHLSADLDRGQATTLIDALGRIDDEDALALMGAFRPGVKPEDVTLLRRALVAFADEVAVEDRRGEARTHRAVKVLDI